MEKAKVKEKVGPERRRGDHKGERQGEGNGKGEVEQGRGQR